jgi:hypothetical protein
MSLKNWTPKVGALVFLGFLCTFLFIASLFRFWEHQWTSATWRLILSLLIFLIFFRHRRFAFAMVALSSILVNAGMSAPFHPSVPGIAATVVSAFLLYWLAVWGTRRYPHLKGKDWKTFFDRDPE